MKAKFVTEALDIIHPNKGFNVLSQEHFNRKMYPGGLKRLHYFILDWLECFPNSMIKDLTNAHIDIIYNLYYDGHTLRSVMTDSPGYDEDIHTGWWQERAASQAREMEEQFENNGWQVAFMHYSDLKPNAKREFFLFQK
jgi:hypothetical protein